MILRVELSVRTSESAEDYIDRYVFERDGRIDRGELDDLRFEVEAALRSLRNNYMKPLDER